MGVIMGAVILFGVLSIAFVFCSGVIYTEVRDSRDTGIMNIFIATVCGFLISIGFFIFSIQRYYTEKCEGKEYSSVKYELKKKVITTEEDNTIKLDTVYTFRPKSKPKV